MAFTKGDEVYVSSSKAKYHGIVQKVDGTALEVLVGRQTVPCQESDCAAVAAADRKLSAPVPAGLTPPVAYNEANPADLNNVMTQETRDKHVADRDALKAILDAEVDDGVIAPGGS